MTSTFHFLSTHFFLPKEKHQHLSSTTLSPIHHPTMLRKNAISTIRTNGHNLRRTDLLALLHQNLLKKKKLYKNIPVHMHPPHISRWHISAVRNYHQKKNYHAHTHAHAPNRTTCTGTAGFTKALNTRVRVLAVGHVAKPSPSAISNGPKAPSGLSPHTKGPKQEKQLERGEREDWRRAGWYKLTSQFIK
jgi:hypothetical protein